MPQQIPMPSRLQKTFELVKPITDYLYGYSLIAVIVVVDALTLNLKLGPNQATSSTLLIGPRGHGKTTLLHHILRKSNPKFFPELRDKLFESEILKEPDEIFNRKVWVQDDLIITFRGTSSKQREQLMGFFNAFLTKGEYGRKERTVRGRIVCIFGIVSEAQKKYSKSMFQSTFMDRFIPVKYGFDENMEREMLKANRRNRRKPLPIVKLPLRDDQVDADIPAAFYSEIDELALELNRKGIMTSARTQTVIENLLKSSAIMNNRDKVCEDDMRLLRLISPLFFGVNLGSIDMWVRMLILEKSMGSQAVTGQEVKAEVMKRLSCSESAIQKSLSELRDESVVRFQKVPLSSGYDFLYWL